MTTDSKKVTSFSTITLLLLKELRIERNMHQAQIADILGKTPSAWNKVESGKSPISFDSFFRICNGLRVSSSAVMAAVERYAALLGNSQWAVVSTEVDFNDDDLLKDAQEYYASAGFQVRTRLINPTVWIYNSVLNGPIYQPDGAITLAEVFLFSIDASFRKAQLDFDANPLKNVVF